MNRRSLFAFLAAAPVAGAFAKEIAEAKPSLPAPAPLPKPEFLFGEMRHVFEALNPHSHTHTFPGGGGGHTHSISGNYPATAIARLKIWDGNQFVDFESPAGIAVYNRARLADFPPASRS